MSNLTPIRKHLPSARARTAQQARHAALQLAYNHQLDKWAVLLQCERDLETSTALYFSGVDHPAREHTDWLQDLVDFGEALSRWMARCIDQLTYLQEQAAAEGITLGDDF